MTNKEIIFHCAPTLANMKVGNMFTIKCDEMSKLFQYIKEKNLLFNEKGVYVHLLKRNKNTALIYVYRRKKLESLLQDEKTQEFLEEYGYHHHTPEYAIAKLIAHLKNPQFPHEVGVFLGYPLEDIRSFIKYEGKNCHCTGCWKVYHNPDEAIKLFKQYKKCIKIYLDCYAQGFDMSRLTVAG